MLEVIIAAASLIIGIIASEIQQGRAEQRSARETKIRSIYQAIKSRYGVSKDQLSQLAENIGIRLSQLSDATRGSARLSRASKILRDYVEQYPKLRTKVNNALNTISDQVTYLDEKENAMASRIINREDVSSADILKDVTPSINRVNTTLTDVNNTFKDEEKKPDNIDTNLVENQVEEGAHQEWNEKPPKLYSPQELIDSWKKDK